MDWFYSFTTDKLYHVVGKEITSYNHLKDDTTGSIEDGPNNDNGPIMQDLQVGTTAPGWTYSPQHPVSEEMMRGFDK